MTSIRTTAPWIATACILSVGIISAWKKTSQLHEVREEQARLLSEAKRSHRHPAGTRRTPRDRPGRPARPASMETTTLDLAKQIDASKSSSGAKSHALERSSEEWLKTLLSLSETQLLGVLSSLKQNTDVSLETRRNLLAFALLALAKERPQTALHLSEQFSPEKNSMVGHTENLALATWAKSDPDAALAWILAKEKKAPGWDAAETKRAFIGGVAAQDPAAAFRSLAQLALKPDDGGLQAIAAAVAGNPDQRSAMIGALRDHLATLPATERENAALDSLSTLARHMGDEDFSSATEWIENADLTSTEIAAFAGGLDYYETTQETGSWIDWLEKKLPANQLSESVTNLMSDWTQQDYQAAGKWLIEAPAGPAKQIAVEAYATAVAEYDPQVAVQWADTLPPDKRQDTYQSIYDSWAIRDRPGADAFAHKHGLEIHPPDKDDSEN